jgi:Uma2 family endonuclease
MSTVETKRITIDDFLAIPDIGDDSLFELIRGRVVWHPTSMALHGLVCANVGSKLLDYDRLLKLGWVCGRVGVVFGQDTLICPDVTYWSRKRLSTIADEYPDIPPDIAVEVLSCIESREVVHEKMQIYILNGVKLVWLVDPDTRTVTVYQGSLRGMELDETDSLTGGDVLPGFSCKLTDIFE